MARVTEEPESIEALIIVRLDRGDVVQSACTRRNEERGGARYASASATSSMCVTSAPGPTRIGGPQ